MGMVKLILPGSYDFGEANTQLIKMAAAGITGNDLRAFIKRAGHKMADAMQKLSFGPGEIPIHLIAIGATEYYGPNRNGDGFSEACCKRYHDTFVKHARWYRNHQNKDPQKSYGVIKYSAYNDTMHRLELIVALNGTKEAARRNGGLLADKELEKIASGKEDWGVSMACKVAYDVCSGCGNRAKTKADYCTASTCPYGGAADNLCKVAEDGHILHVDNPHPTWFDISDVYRPADRIAYVFGKLEKAASGKVLSSADLAYEMGVTAPFDLEIKNVSDRKVREQIKLAYELAEIERTMLTTGMTKMASAVPVVRTQLHDLEDVGRDVSTRGQVLKALARQKIAMSLPDFIQFTSGFGRQRAEEVAREVQPNLYGLFGRMCDDVEKLASDLTRNPFRPCDTEPSGKWTLWAEKQANQASLSRECVTRRAWAHAIRDESVTVDFSSRELTKTAASEGLARAYGLYKLAFLYEIREMDPELELTSNLVVRQNYVS
jgi:hypothetical protein